MALFDFIFSGQPDPLAVEAVQNFAARARVHEQLYLDLTAQISAAGPNPPADIQASLNYADAAVTRERGSYNRLRSAVQAAVTTAYREKAITREDAAIFAQLDAGPAGGLGLLPLLIIAAGVAVAVCIAATKVGQAAIVAADGAVAKEQAEAQAILASTKAQIQAWKFRQATTPEPVAFPPLIIPKTNPGALTTAAQSAGQAAALVAVAVAGFFLLSRRSRRR